LQALRHGFRVQNEGDLSLAFPLTRKGSCAMKARKIAVQPKNSVFAKENAFPTREGLKN
jgi:hypothetical protein